MPEGAVNEPSYNGTFTYSVDAKGRLTLPFKDTEVLLVVVWPFSKVGTCLRVFPPAQAEKLLKELDSIPNDNPGKSAMKRQIGSNSVKVKPDSVGRIAIPANMLEEAALDGEAVVAGMWDKFELWNPGRYKELKKRDLTVLEEAGTVKYIES